MDYLSEIKKLPKDIRDILISFFGAKINREIIKDYNLSEVQASDFIDLVNDIYLKKVKIEFLGNELSSRLKLDPKKVNELTVDILGKKLLIADDYFSGKVKESLQSLGVSLTTFTSIIAQEQVAIAQEVSEREEDYKDEVGAFEDVLLDLDEDPEFKEQSKKDSLQLFKDNLDELLKLDSKFNDIITDYNEDLFEFMQDEVFARNLQNILYNNTNTITRIKPILDNDSKQATASNWLKDFIAFHGSKNFNAIVLAEYLVNSPSAKRLSKDDKSKIKRLLNIYRNVVFFLENTRNASIEIEVIPLALDRTNDDKLSLSKKSEIEREDDLLNEFESEEEDKDKKIKEVIDLEIKKLNIIAKESSSEIGLSESHVNEPVSETTLPQEVSLLDELKSMLQDYPSGSLEYKTISQEIKRLDSFEDK